MKVGIIGAGAIARKMAATIAQMQDAEVWAVASRSLDKARQFQAEFDLPEAYGSYQEMLDQSPVDLVYIATPHSEHLACVKLCLDRGKAVLCEKAFAGNARQAQEMIELARQKKVLLAEAIWTRYQPARLMLNELMASGIIGNVHSLQADLSYAMAEKQRIWDPALAGGALLDIGVYTLNFAMMCFGDDYKDLTGQAVLTETGVDLTCSMTMTWPDGKLAQLHSSAAAHGNRKGFIYGDKGYIEVENINNPQWFRVYGLDYQLMKVVNVPVQITGYEYEVEACRKALLEGKTEVEEMPLDLTLKIMEAMDQLRAGFGVIYPFD